MITVLKVIFAVIKLCCKMVYGALKFFRVRILALYLVICGLVQLIFHSFDGKAYVFWAGLGVCAVITLLSWIFFLKGKSRRSRVKREEETQEEEPEREKTKKEKRVRKARRLERPKYYDVAGREGYIFAEYSDRYELYFKGEGGYMLVRTDYKKPE